MGCSFVVDAQGQVAQQFGGLAAYLFRGFIETDVFVVAGLGLAGGREDGFRKLVALLQTSRQRALSS